MPEKRTVGIASKIPWPRMLAEQAWGFPTGYMLTEKLPRISICSCSEERGRGESVATRYAGHHKQTTRKMHVLNGAEF